MQFLAHAPTTADETSARKVEMPPVAISSYPPLDVLEGRPNVASIIEEVLHGAGQHENIVVAACGPDSLVNATRQAAPACISASGPAVELHCEQYGW